MVTDRKNQNGCGRNGANRTANIHASHGGHHQVRDDQVGRPLAKYAYAFFRIVGGAHIEALGGKRCAKDPRNLRFVVDYQNSTGHVRVLCSKAYIIWRDGYDFPWWDR